MVRLLLFRSGTGPEGLAGEVAGARHYDSRSGTAKHTLRTGPTAEFSPSGPSCHSKPPQAAPLRPAAAVGEPTKRLQAGVDIFVGVIVRTAGQLLPADDAEPRAILAAQRRNGLRKLDGFADLALQLKLVVVVEPEHVGLLVDIERNAAFEIDDRQGFLVDLDLDRPLDLLQTAAALLFEGRRESRAHQHAAVRAGQPDAALQTLGLPEIGSEIESRPKDDVVANGAGGLGQQP